MIRPPHRSVTRFFIPLIDVLILMFCIFLLMPLVEEGAVGAGGDSKLTAGQAEQLRQENGRLLERIFELEKTRESDPALIAKIKDLQAELDRPIDKKLFVRTFYFDPDTGTLQYYNERRELVPVPEQGDAVLLISGDKEKAGREGRTIYYLFSRHGARHRPYRGQREEYERWFQGRASFGWEDGSMPGTEKRP